MHKLALVAFMTACTTGLSWTGGMQGGTRTTASNSSPTPAILPSTGHPFDVNSDCFGEHGRVDYHRDPVLLWPCFDYADDKGTAEYSELRTARAHHVHVRHREHGGAAEGVTRVDPLGLSDSVAISSTWC